MVSRRSGLLLAVALLAMLVFACVTEASKAQSTIKPRPTRSVLSTKVTPGQWRTWWGNATIGSNSATLSSAVPTSPTETHSALVTTKRTWRDQSVSFTTSTLEQLRVGSAPNPWEVAWVMFRFQDLENYYWFILKPNGYELGKKQGSDTQIFLVTGDTPTLVLNQRDRVKIQVRGPRIRVLLNGEQIVDFVDPNPLLSGSVGLYEEDSRVRFDSLAISAA